MSQSELLIQVDQLKSQNLQLRSNVRSLELEIQERCQNYMMEITYLRSQTKKHPNQSNKSLQNSRMNGSTSNASSSRVTISSEAIGVQTDGSHQNGLNETNDQQSIFDSSPHQQLKEVVSQQKYRELEDTFRRRQKQLELQIESLRKQFELNIKESSDAYKQEISVKNQQINELFEQLKEINGTKNQDDQQSNKTSQIAELKKKIQQQQNTIEKQNTQYQIAVNEFKKLEPSIQKSRAETEVSQKLDKIVNCLKKGFSVKFNPKSSKEDQIVQRKSYSSQKILYKLKRRMEYIVVTFQIYKGMVKYILDITTGEKIPNQPKIRQQFEEVYQQLSHEIGELEENLFTTQILKESLMGEKQILEKKLKEKERMFKKLSVSDQESILQKSISEKEVPMISSASKIASTPKSFKTPERSENLERSDVRSLNSSNVKLRVELIHGHYMMMDHKKTVCENCKQSRQYFNEEISRLLQEKDKKIQELESKYEKLLDQKIVVTPGYGKREVLVVQEIDIPVSTQQSQYVKRHTIRTASKPKMSQEVILSLSRSKKNVYTNLVNNMENIQEAIQTLRKEKTEKSLEKMGKLERINEKIEKLAIKYSPCKRITERLSDLQEDSVERKSESRVEGELKRGNRFDGRKR